MNLLNSPSPFGFGLLFVQKAVNEFSLVTSCWSPGWSPVTGVLKLSGLAKSYPLPFCDRAYEDLKLRIRIAHGATSRS